MNNIEDEVNRVVEDLVAQLVDLAYRSVRQRLESAGSAADRDLTVTDNPRRTPAEIGSLSDRFIAHVQAHPGLHINELNEQLGTTSRDLRLPIRKLVADGRIVTRGKTRGRTYYARPLSIVTAEHPALPAHRPVTPPLPSVPGVARRQSSGADDLCNLASLSRLYDGAELDPGLGRFLADVLTLSRRLRE